jgi:hypothetical protein
LECLLDHKLLSSFGVDTHASGDTLGVNEDLFSSVLLVKFVMLANDLLLLTKSILITLGFANIYCLTSSGLLSLSETHFKVFNYIKINNLMLARVFNRKFSTSPITQTLQVMTGEYDIRIKSYSSASKCIYNDILAQHKTCYFIRGFPDEISAA